MFFNDPPIYIGSNIISENEIHPLHYFLSSMCYPFGKFVRPVALLYCYNCTGGQLVPYVDWF